MEEIDLPSQPEVKAPPPNPQPNAKTINERPRITIVQVRTSSSTKYTAQTSSTSIPVLSLTRTKSNSEPPTIPPKTIPDRKIRPPKMVDEDDDPEEIHPIGPPGRQEYPSFTAVPTTIHWEKQPENFPVPTGSIVRLPTGAAAVIPKIQHNFNDETRDEKINREKRQASVKAEFKKAWSGYKEHAWLHDELMPFTGKFKDPFCGWAATLVDALDTLWIMGFEKEFEEAARAVDLIDFTTSPRADIPVFETTIRYLGGLLAAYDVSGGKAGKYQNLLSKAVELAEILIGAFDTPNRMPVLYYRWKPAFASQPHRASQRSNIAELGSLSMEFTRLAQLTQDPRYYDAVARVTNALSEYQDRGTKLGSVFPDNVDASGCNRTVPHVIQSPIAVPSTEPFQPANLDEPPEGFRPQDPATVKERKPLKSAAGREPNTLELDIVPGELSKARIASWDDNHQSGTVKRSEAEVEYEVAYSNTTSSTPTASELNRKLPTTEVATSEMSPLAPPLQATLPVEMDLSKAKAKLADTLGSWDCTPQGVGHSESVWVQSILDGRRARLYL